MFPYYWNSAGTVAPYGLPALNLFDRDRELNNLPEEVQEAIEAHKDEMRSAEDIRRFVEKLDLKK